MVPSGATELGFTLVVSGRSGIARSNLLIPLELHARPMLPPVVVADAGDDQLAIVGHRVTLNGIRSRPRAQSAYRWIQVSGPTVEGKVEESWICSFMPPEPGTYRFLLVTSAEGTISEPDEVLVHVRAESPQLPSRKNSRGSAIEIAARQGVEALRVGPDLARELATAFEMIADRVTLYSTYADLFSETSRRLDALLPRDPVQRSAWEREFLEPLTAEILRSLKDGGLDLSQPGSETVALTEAQKQTLATLFQGVSVGVLDGVEGRNSPDRAEAVGDRPPNR